MTQKNNVIFTTARTSNLSYVLISTKLFRWNGLGTWNQFHGFLCVWPGLGNWFLGRDIALYGLPVLLLLSCLIETVILGILSFSISCTRWRECTKAPRHRISERLKSVRSPSQNALQLFRSCIEDKRARISLLQWNLHTFTKEVFCCCYGFCILVGLDVHLLQTWMSCWGTTITLHSQKLFYLGFIKHLIEKLFKWRL
jgi:hypothetical protein